MKKIIFLLNKRKDSTLERCHDSTQCLLFKIAARSFWLIVPNTNFILFVSRAVTAEPSAPDLAVPHRPSHKLNWWHKSNKHMWAVAYGTQAESTEREIRHQPNAHLGSSVKVSNMHSLSIRLYMQLETINTWFCFLPLCSWLLRSWSDWFCGSRHLGPSSATAAIRNKGTSARRGT